MRSVATLPLRYEENEKLKMKFVILIEVEVLGAFVY